MKIPADGNEAFNVIIVGQWNPAIFSPTWVQSNVASAADAEVSMALAIGPVTMPPRLTVERTNLYPSLHSLVFDCVELSDDALEDCSAKIGKIAHTLPHTPVQGIGVNFRFHGNIDESAEFAELFTFSDAAGIDAQVYAPVSAAVKRSFRLDGDDQLNLSVEHNLGGAIRCEFNFHTTTGSMAIISEKVSAARLKDLRQQAVEFLRQAYNVEVN